MKNVSLKIIILLFAVFGFSKVQATHIMGMSIAYEHINGDTFEVYLDFFEYCGGSAFNGTPTSAASGGYGGFSVQCPDLNSSNSFNAPLDTLIDASPICAPLAATQNSCVAGWQTGLLGIRWYKYKQELVLSTLTQSSCSEFVIYYGTGARNTGANYIGQPSIAAYTTLKQQSYPNNSSPRFTTNKPVPFFCDGQAVTYNWGASEQDGDSLVWELDTAVSTYNNVTGFNYINYTAFPFVYTGIQPMQGVNIDPATGELTFIAFKDPNAIASNYAIAVKVSEYDPTTGVRISTTQRDVQFIVTDSCANIPPQQDTNGLLNFGGSGAQIGPNTIEVCVGQDFEFDVAVFDLDTSGNFSNDSLTITCNIDLVLPGATWSIGGGTNPDTIHISWTSIPVTQTFVPFNITVEDDNCPVTGFNIYNYNILIRPATFLGPDTAICSLDTIQLDANGGDTFSWSILYGDPIAIGQNFGCVQCQDPWIHPSQTTAYVVTSNLSATCGNTDTIVIEVFNQFPVMLEPVNGGTVDTVVYCATDGLDTLVAQTPGGTFLGPGIVNAVEGVFAPDIVDPGFGNDTTVTVTYVLQGICANTSQLNIRVKGLPDARVLTEGPFCKFSESEQLEGYQSGGTWVGPNTTATGDFDPSAYANTAPDTVRIFHTINDSGCVNTDSADLRVIDEYSSAIDSLPKICAGEELLIHLNDFEGDPFGTWIGDDITEDPVGSGEFYFNTAGMKAGSYSITYEIEGLCGTSTTKDLLINLLPDASIFGADSVYCDNILDSVLLETAREEGRWGGSLVELHDGYFVPSNIGEGFYTLSYELYDTVTTCYNKQVVDVRIARTPVRPKVKGGGPYCKGDNWNVRGDGLLSNTYKWYTWNGITDSPDSIPSTADMDLLGAGNPFFYGELVDMPTIIYATQVSEFGCESAYSRLETEVKPSPNALFAVDTTATGVSMAADGAVSGNVPLELTFVNFSTPDSGSLTYSWQFGDYESYDVSNANSQSYIFPEIGTYTVYLIADNGQCTDTHAVIIRTDRVTNFFIPNVFTPNGDNQNDLFVWDIEGIEEFQITIYNRWGTKVFSSDELDGEWDGGNEPDGTYFYVVTGKEATLDAETVEWRGDLTLIRNK